MTNISDISPLFFELTAKNTDPNKDLWEGITGYKIPYTLPMRELKLLDKESGRIYKFNESTSPLTRSSITINYNVFKYASALLIEFIASRKLALNLTKFETNYLNIKYFLDTCR